MQRGVIDPASISRQNLHQSLLGILHFSIGIFGESYKRNPEVIREPIRFVGHDMIETCDLALIYDREKTRRMRVGIPVELKTGNVTGRDLIKAYRQLHAGSLWINERYNLPVPYGILIIGQASGEIEWDRIDIDKLRSHVKEKPYGD